MPICVEIIKLRRWLEMVFNSLNAKDTQRPIMEILQEIGLSGCIQKVSTHPMKENGTFLLVTQCLFVLTLIILVVIIINVRVITAREINTSLHIMETLTEITDIGFIQKKSNW